MTFFDVGQGDSILINTGRHQQILIDGGPDNTIISKLSQTLPIFDHNIELLILTHPHADHITGLNFVLENYQVENIIIPKINTEDSLMNNFISLAHQKNANIIFGSFPTSILLENISLKILYPFNSQPIDNTDPNDNSLVLLVNDQNTKKKILLTGDISKNIEIKLIKKYQQALDVDILKIAHHGSDSSTSQSFLDITTPQTAVISCGQNNKFHHPSNNTIDHLQAANIGILRTDQKQDISFPL